MFANGYAGRKCCIVFVLVSTELLLPFPAALVAFVPSFAGIMCALSAQKELHWYEVQHRRGNLCNRLNALKTNYGQQDLQKRPDSGTKLFPAQRLMRLSIASKPCQKWQQLSHWDGLCLGDANKATSWGNSSESLFL